jgi:nitrate reductase molybdenum cofactor assembly chaperone
MPPVSHYERLGALFDYPDADYPARVAEARDALVTGFPTAARHLEAFARGLPGGEASRLETRVLNEVQEIFTRSFDVQSITTLSVGYVMFGDDYKRGELLVNLSRELDAAGIDCGVELPDHLPNVLRLLARWEDPELAREFVQEILYPALRMMIEEFGAARMEQRDRLYRKHFKTLIASSAERGSMFCNSLMAVVAVLERDFDLSAPSVAPRGNDFLGFVGRELDIELTEGRPNAARNPS